MRANKIILSMAVAAALPFTANATQTVVETNTPARVGSNGTVKKAAATGPYVTNEPTAADQTHIATTAYVKGAYNDAIAAVNKTADSLTNLINDRQYKLTRTDNGDEIESSIVIFSSLGADLVYPYDDGEFDAVYENITRSSGSENLDNALMSAGSAVRMVYEAGQQIQQTKQNQLTTTINNTSQDISSTVAQTVNTTTPSATTLVSEAAIAGAINGATSDMATNTALNSKRVRIYTTWDDDTVAATTLVPFETAQ